MGKKIPVKDHLGQGFESITSMCEHYGISIRLYSDRVSRGFTLEEALGVEQKKKDNYTVDELLSMHGLSVEQYQLGKDLGLSLSDTKKLAAGQLHIDHEMRVYTSFNKMCQSWGKNASTVRARLKRGYSLEEALEE